MTSAPFPPLSVVVPMYNEEANVEGTVREIFAKIAPRVADCEIILVDDGSRDRTGALSDALAAADSRIRVVHHPANRGYGAALRSGFGKALHAHIFYTDGDLQFDLDQIDRLLPLVEGADIVTSYRIDRQDPWHRRFNGKLFNRVVRILFGVRLRDLDCAFKIYRKDLFETVRIDSEGILVSAEILVQATRQGKVIREVGVDHFPRRKGQPTGNNPLVVLTAMLELVRFCWRMWLRRPSP